MDIRYPNIRIERGWPLEEAALMVAKQLDPFLKEHQKNFSAERMEKKVKEYRTAWAKSETTVLRGICEILNLEFSHNIINVHVVSCWTSAMSSPLIIPSYYSSDEFPHILTHELLHRLLCDNTQGVDTLSIQQKMFPAGFTSVTRNHIILHAAHKIFLLKVLCRPDLWAWQLKKHQKFPDYKASCDYVETTGYLEIVNDFRRLAGLNT